MISLKSISLISVLQRFSISRVPSASSRLDFWVQSLEFSPGVVDFELPNDTPLFGVGFLGPSSDLGL